jgi:thiol-disulfide isomerase/thioredoxin
VSQSPTETDSANSSEVRRYLAGWEALHRLIREGKSISGRERHCCYLNIGNNHFADISSVTGLDLVDDGRAVALTDWDHDGDLDMWITNRTSPAIRFLRNDLKSANHFLSVRFVGRECNRDAIDARVELFTVGEDKPWSVKTVRAGNGFLAQSSKWLHFGLGQLKQVDRLVVHWPGGNSETFRGLVPGGRFDIVQGTAQARQVEPQRTPVELAASQPPKPPAGAGYRVLTMPGRAPLLKDVGRGPKLVALWASWCAPCLIELQGLTARQADLRAAGLQVLAVNVDDVDSRDDFDSSSAEKLLTQMNFPFPHSRADERAMETFEHARQSVVDKPGTFALPTSFLVDWDGRVRAVYIGGVEVDQLLADVKLLHATPTQFLDAAVTFEGKWLGPPPNLPTK